MRYFAPLLLLAIGMIEVACGLKLGRVFGRFGWAQRRERPMEFWFLMGVSACLAILGGFILVIETIQPACLHHAGAFAIACSRIER